MTQRVAIVEDDERFLSTLRIFFEHLEGFELADTFRAAEPALAEAQVRAGEEDRAPWDMVLMDLELPQLHGIEATRQLKARWPAMPVVILTAFEDPAAILEAICAGADGYLVKRISARELRHQLQSIVEGGAPLTADVARTVLRLLRHSTVGTAPRDSEGIHPTRLDLTTREQDVLRCLVRGMSYKQTAEELGISLDTVRGHVRGVYRKLQVHSVAHAVSRAVREHLV